jgi:hypothetical protein
MSGYITVTFASQHIKLSCCSCSLAIAFTSYRPIILSSLIILGNFSRRDAIPENSNFEPLIGDNDAISVAFNITPPGEIGFNSYYRSRRSTFHAEPEHTSA